MARIVITVTDSPLDGTVSFVVDPSLQSLLERKKRFGATSLSTAEVYAVIALQKMLEHARSNIAQKGAHIIVPGMDS